MLRETCSHDLGNEPEAPSHDRAVVDEYTGELATRMALADDDVIDRVSALAVGGVGIGDVPSWRIDPMPEIRRMVVRTPPA